MSVLYANSDFTISCYTGEVQPQKVVKSGQITSSDRLFNDIAVELCEKYYEVGLELGLQGKVLTNELETGKFTMQQGSKKALKMLQLWRDNVDKDKCTYSVLAAALEKRGFQRCADEYCYTRSTRIGNNMNLFVHILKGNYVLDYYFIKVNEVECMVGFLVHVVTCCYFSISTPYF